MNLKEEIRKLVDLQEIDLEIHRLKKEKDIIKPAFLKEIKDAFEESKKNLVEFEEQLKNSQLQKKDREVELASKEESLRKSQGQLLQLKTNKEYHAKLTEIGSCKADISVAEEEVIKILDEIESKKDKLDQAKKVLAEEESKFKQNEKKIIEEIKEVETELLTLENKRRVIVNEIDKNIVSRYESLLKTRNGSAIVAVKSNSCSACYLSLTHQKVNAIKMYEDLVSCESCVRLLYLPEDIF
ncbi:MAG: hypothetical protein K9L86_01940 [Candidatus Omnitrophica bacterium]|nr:hypothetical protein [Candidatus Omnitrophota bacterium]